MDHRLRLEARRVQSAGDHQARAAQGRPHLCGFRQRQVHVRLRNPPAQGRRHHRHQRRDRDRARQADRRPGGRRPSRHLRHEGRDGDVGRRHAALRRGLPARLRGQHRRRQGHGDRARHRQVLRHRRQDVHHRTEERPGAGTDADLGERQDQAFQADLRGRRRVRPGRTGAAAQL